MDSGARPERSQVSTRTCYRYRDVNFIGHLHLSRFHSTDPAYALGAMLPDFASMARVKLGRVGNARIRAGIALHHRTDAAFHGQPLFVSLMRETETALAEQGVTRGPARAVGHVGVEMLIDGELVHDRDNGEAYLLALAQTERLERDEGLSPETRTNLARLHQRLAIYGVPYDYRNTEAVVTRLTRALSGRPMLALSPEEARIVGRVLPEIQRRVVVTVESLVDAVRHALLNEGVPAE